MSFRYLLLAILLSFLPFHAHAQAGAFNLEDWPATAANLKPVYVKAIMEQAGVHKVTFTLTPEFYAAQLDKFATFATQHNNKMWLQTSVAQNLATIAVVHCDWNNGVPHWEFAQRYLGDEQLGKLTPLYPEAIARLKNNCTETTAE